MTDVPEFLRAGEIARLTGISLRTVRRWIAEKWLPSVKLRGVRLVPRKDLEQLLSPTPPNDFDDGELSIITSTRDIIGKTTNKNTFHLLYDRIPECHPLTPHVTRHLRRSPT
jgi:excisionase family DNA binding protein